MPDSKARWFNASVDGTARRKINSMDHDSFIPQTTGSRARPTASVNRLTCALRACGVAMPDGRAELGKKLVVDHGLIKRKHVAHNPVRAQPLAQLLDDPRRVAFAQLRNNQLRSRVIRNGNQDPGG